MTQNPIFSYAFNDSDLGVDTISGFNLTNTNVTLVTDPDRGPVASFDGSTSNLASASNVPSSITGSGPRTFMVWLKKANSNANMFFYDYGSADYGLAWRGQITASNMYLINMWTMSTSSTAIQNDTWIHLASTHDGENTRTYINGVESGNTYGFNSTTRNAFNTGASPLWIGYRGIIGGVFFEGLMSDFRVYDFALSESEVSTAMSSDFPSADQASTPRYQSDPPVAGAVSYLRVNDLGSLQDGDTVSSWGSASTTGSPVYKNDSTYDFPYVQLNGGYFTLGNTTIQPSLGFTFVGYVLTTSVGPQYPLIFSYAEGQNDGIRMYRTGGTGQDLVFRSQKAGSIEARADDATTTNTWQVFTSRVTDNGDSTVTMEIFLDNVLQGSTTSASSDMSGIVSGLLEVGQSTAWGGNPVSPIYVSDMYFYDRALSDTELGDMHTYLQNLGENGVATSYKYQFDPPVSDSVASLRVRDLDSLANNDTITTWGTSTATQNPIYKNDSTYNFPYVDLNGGVIDLGTYPIVSADGFTYTGLVLSTNVSTLYPPIFTYMSARDDGLRLIRSGAGADLYFYSDGPKRTWAGPATVTDVNTWQVFSVRASNNGDNTVTMDLFVDNMNMATNTVPVSDFCDNTSGHIDVGKSSLYPTDDAIPIYISDTFFYDRALSDTELGDMHTYLTTLGDPLVEDTPPDTTTFIEDGVVMYVDANNEASYTPGSKVMNDLSGSSVVFDMDPTVSTSLNDGGLDFSAGTNYLKLSQALQVQTISLWYKKGISPAGKFIDMRDTNGGGETVANMNQSTIQGDFFLNGSIYVNGVLTSGEDYVNLADDTWYNVVFVGSYLTQPTRLTLFANLNLQYPYKLIFGSALFYDRVLTEAEIAHNYSVHVPDQDDSDLIVKSGLVLHVNTSNDLSWNNTGTTLYNIVEDSTSNLELTGSDYTTEDNQINVVYTGAGNTATLKTTGAVQVQTVMFWIKRNASNHDEYLIDGRYDIGNSYIILGGSLGSFWSGDFYVNGVLLSNNYLLYTIPLDEWTSVVVTGSSSTTGSIRLLNGNGRNMEASLRIVLVYDRILTQEEVTQNHNQFLAYDFDNLGTSDPNHDLVFSRQSPVSFEVNWLDVPEAEFYRLTKEYGDSGEIVLETDTTSTNVFVQNLSPDTSYLVRLYVRTAGTLEYVLTSTNTGTTTSASSAENYTQFVEDVQDDATGVFDMSNIDKQKFDLMGDFLDDIFETGSSIILNVDSEEVLTRFVKKGSSVTLDSGAILTPFSENNGTGQFIEVETEEGNKRLEYSHVTNTVEVEGVSYGVGDTIFVGGRRVRIIEN